MMLMPRPIDTTLSQVHKQNTLGDTSAIPMQCKWASPMGKVREIWARVERKQVCYTFDFDDHGLAAVDGWCRVDPVM